MTVDSGIIVGRNATGEGKLCIKDDVLELENCVTKSLYGNTFSLNKTCRDIYNFLLDT